VTLAALALPLAAVPAAHAARGLSQRAVLSARVRHVRVGGVDFAYRSIGSGRPLLLPSNLQARMSNWDPAVLARVAARHRVIIYDHRGVGLSKGDVSHMTMAQLADDAARLIRKLRLGRPDVWGQRMGGSVAELLAIRHPTRVRRLVLTAALAGGGHIVNSLGGAPWFTDFTADAAGRAAQRAYEARAARWRPQETISPAASNAEYAMAARYSVLPAEGAWRGLPRVRARVFVAGGRRDVVTPPGNSRIIAARLRHATLRFYPSGHGFHIQDRWRFVPDLLRFLRKR
jgi:pimeloyl-ACP methyl ester carboxylesterase